MRAVKFCSRKKPIRSTRPIPYFLNTFREAQRADCTKQSSAGRNSAAKYTSFPLHTAKKMCKSSSKSVTISYSIRRRRSKNLRRFARRRAFRSGFGSTPNAPRRKGTRSMIRAHPDRGSEQRSQTLTRAYFPFSTDCISIRSANKTATIWKQRYTLFATNSENICTI